MATLLSRLESLAANLPGDVMNKLFPGCPQIEEEVRGLCRRVRRIQALLRDAEEREIRDEGVKLWLDELRDVAYDAEDVLEELEHELMMYPRLSSGKEEDDRNAHQKRGNKGKLRTQVRKICNFLLGTRGEEDDQSAQHIGDMRRGLHVHQIIAKIKDINNRFEEIYKDREALNLGVNDGRRRGNQELEQRPPTSSVLGDSNVYGRDEDSNKVIDLLLSSESHEHGTKNVSVVSIEGMGGVGKTTLAQLVYRDDRVKNHFQEMLWVCVSDCFDVIWLTKEILEALPGGTSGLQGLNPLQEKLQKSLEGRRFLLVLDDLWNDNVGQWEALWKPLSNGAAGSKVLITTRNEEVSRVSRATGRHCLKGLLKDDSWSLFAKYAFGDKNPNDYLNLASIGAEIVKKCGGLPLAIRTLGGLLFNESDEDKWKDILNSDTWELRENGILPALKLSYHYLPSAIKPCFAFCAVFPKDFVFNSETLVLLWMAQGYIEPTRGRCMEDIGRNYVDDLLQRSLFQNDSDGFKMHDLIHDLALSLRGPECATIEDSKLSKTHDSTKIRHLLLKHHRDVKTSLPQESANTFQCVRTFYLMGSSGYYGVSSKFVDDMFSRMKYLRALALSDFIVRELPDSVGNLKHLRYLSFQEWSSSGLLPETLGDLFHLQTLIIRTSRLKELPKRLTDLVNLRHLRIQWISISNSWNGDYYAETTWESLRMMPRGIGKLTQLCELPLFVVGDGTDAAGIEELRDLNDLRGTLHIVIKRLDNWVNKEPGILIHKKGLKDLKVTFQVVADESRLASMMLLQEELLESMQPHTNIKELSITGYAGIRLPKWMEKPSYSNLEKIELKYFKNCQVLPAFGQLPSLKKLKVWGMYALTSVGPEFMGDGASVFASLEELEFEHLPVLEGWSIGTDDRIGAIPHLHSMKIQSCPKLTSVKLRHLTALEILEIEVCHDLTTLDCGSPSRLRQSANHIPSIKTMILKGCPKLNFPPAEWQWLPSSLKVLYSSLEVLHASIGSLFYFNITVNDDYLFKRDTSYGRKVEDYMTENYDRLKKYVFRWDLERHKFSFTPAEAEQLLQSLHPPPYQVYFLQELLIEGYLGRRFCDWVGDPHYLSNLVKMTLSGCIHCEHLPPVGRLPLLQELYISNMPELQLVGCECCIDEGGSEKQYFPKLQVLTIINCPKLRSFQLPALLDTPCDPSSSSSALHLFPHLGFLHIQDCPELASLVGIHGISSLRVLSLVRCPNLDFSAEAPLPTGLQLANITGCPLLSGWCQGGRISHVRRLWVDGRLAFSDGTDVNGSLNALSEIMETGTNPEGALQRALMPWERYWKMMERALLNA